MTHRRAPVGALARLVLAVGLLGSVVALATDTAGAAGVRRARRALVFAVPYTSWEDIDPARTPALAEFARRAAVAGLSTRVHERETPLGDGYATIGAGSRAVSVADATQGGLMVDERFGAVTAGDAYAQRTGRDPGDAIVQTAIVGLLGANARLDYDAEVGALAEALARAGIARAVVGNADGREPDAGHATHDPTPAPARRREAVLGLMDHAGHVPAGRVDPGILAADPDAPFGVRLDESAVVSTATEAWDGRAVVLVEASDLVRVARYRPYTTDVEHARLRDAALARTDRLFAALLEHVDPARDLVMVVGPAHEPDRVTLTPLAVRGPGFREGLLRSATTRRDGFVQLHDIAPTLLDALGVDPPSVMEGRPARMGSTGGDAGARIDRLRTADAAARFRDDRIGEVYLVLVACATAMVATGIAAAARDRGRTAGRALALFSLGLLASAFLVRLGPVHEAGVAGFDACWFAVAALVAACCALLGRRRRLDELIAGLGVVVAVLALDALRGAPLVLNSVLGYSPTVAGRFAGFGNPAYAAFSAAALLAAVLVAHRLGGRRGSMVAGAILGGAVVIDAAPMWGSDVGGILSMVPAYAVTLVLLSGRRVRARTVVAAVVAVGVVAALAAFADFARPEADRTHLGRLVERVADHGPGDLWSVIDRKLAMNLATVRTSVLGLVLLSAVVGAAVLWRRHPARVRAVVATVPEWRAACVGFVVLAVLGFALNDSGMTVPGIMLVVFVAAWLHLLASTPPPERSGGPVDVTDRVDDGDEGDEGEDAGVAAGARAS